MATNIASERKRLDITQGDLAKRLNVSEATIRYWEHGKRLIPSDKLIQMRNFFGCTIDYLLKQTEERI